MIHGRDDAGLPRLRDGSRSREIMAIIIFIREDVLVGGVSKQAIPGIGLEVRQVLDGGSNGGKPIIKDNMELGGNGTCGRVQNKRDRGGM